MGLLPEGYPHRAVNIVATPRLQIVLPGKQNKLPPDYVVAPFSNLLGTKRTDKPVLAESALVSVASAQQSVRPSETQRKQDLRELLAKFSQVFDDVCRPMRGIPCHFVLKDCAVPVAIRRSRPVPEPLLPVLLQELELLQTQGIIRRVG